MNPILTDGALQLVEGTEQDYADDVEEDEYYNPKRVNDLSEGQNYVRMGHSLQERDKRTRLDAFVVPGPVRGGAFEKKPNYPTQATYCKRRIPSFFRDRFWKSRTSAGIYKGL